MNGVKTVRLIAAARYFHDGRLLHVGDEFQANEQEAKDLCALNFARRVPIAQLLKPRIGSVPIETTAVEPVDIDAPAEKSEQRSDKPRRGRYTRRDLRATK